MQRNVSLCLTGVSSTIPLMIIKCCTITEEKNKFKYILFELNHYRENIFILNPEKYLVHKLKFKYVLSFGLKTHRP